MASKQWFILKTDHHIGPLDFEQILELYQNRRVIQDDKLWCEGMSDWLELNEIKDFSELFPSEEIHPVSEEEADFPPDLPPLPLDLVPQTVLKEAIELTEKPDELPPLPTTESSSGVSPKQFKLLPQEDLPVFEFDLEKENSGQQDIAEEDFNEELVELKDTKEPEFFEEDPQEDPSDSLADEEHEEEDFWDDQIEQEPVGESPKDKKFWIIAVFTCIIVALGSLVVFRSTKVAPLFHELRVQDGQRLESFLKENKSLLNEEKMPFDFSLSRDGRGLMVVSPYPLEAKLYLELESIKGQVLSFEDLLLKSESTLANHQAWFRELNLQTGMSLAPGLYRYKITAIPVGPIANFRRFLQKNGIAKGAMQRFEAAGEIWLIRENRAEFDKKLAVYRERVNTVQLSPLQERIQQYQTLEQMAEQILNIYREVLPNVNKRSDLQEFEKKYSQRVGPLLQTLILEAHQKSVELSLDQPEEALTFERLRDFGREVGELVSDMVTTTEETKNLDVVKRNRLLRQFENRVKNLQKESQKRRAVIEIELESFR